MTRSIIKFKYKYYKISNIAIHWAACKLYEVGMLTLTLQTCPRAPVWSHKSVQPHPSSCTVVDHNTVLCWDGMFDFPTWSGQPVVIKFSQYLCMLSCIWQSKIFIIVSVLTIIQRRLSRGAGGEIVPPKLSSLHVVLGSSINLHIYVGA